MSEQRTLAMAAGVEKHQKYTRRVEFLQQMEIVIPRGELCAEIELFYPKAGNGRPPVGLERMLRMYFLQQWFNLSEHVFAPRKRRFGFLKVGYRGLAKNLHRLYTSLALINLLTAQDSWQWPGSSVSKRRKRPLVRTKSPNTATGKPKCAKHRNGSYQRRPKRKARVNSYAVKKIVGLRRISAELSFGDGGRTACTTLPSSQIGCSFGTGWVACLCITSLSGTWL